MDLNRRNFIKATGAAALTGLAGCAGDNKDSTPQKEETDQGTSGEDNTSNQETRIEFLESHDINTVPIVRDSNIDDTAGIRLEVEDKDGIEQIEVAYNDSHRDEPLTLYDKTKDEFEQGVNGEMVPISGEFPQRMIAPKTGEFQIEVTDVNGNTQTRTEPLEGLTKAWKVDRPQSNNYQTERNWDNLRFNRQQFHDQYVSKWHQEAVYDVVLRELEQENQEKYNAANAQTTYSNSKYEIGEVDGPGYWDPEFYNQLTQLEYIIGDARNTIPTHQSTIHDGAFSAWNHRFAATLEDIIHTFNGPAKKHLEETGEKAIHTGWVDETRHGTVITYTDLENTNIEGEHPWQYVDTTDSTVKPITDNINLHGNYNPFVEGYGSRSGMTYRGEKQKAIGGISHIVHHDKDNGENPDPNTIDISDDILQDIFNEHIPSKGSINPILDMIEKAMDLQIETGNYIHIYGEDLDEYEIAVAEDDELYEMSMTPDIQVGTEEVENYLTDLPA